MKSVIGLVLVVLGVLSFFFVNIACIVWAIMDIVSMGNGDTEVSFFSIFGLVSIFLLRELFAAVIAGAMIAFGFSFMD